MVTDVFLYVNKCRGANKYINALFSPVITGGIREGCSV